MFPFPPLLFLILLLILINIMPKFSLRHVLINFPLQSFLGTPAYISNINHTVQLNDFVKNVIPINPPEPLIEFQPTLKIII